jgi:hypothetical protein
MIGAVIAGKLAQPLQVAQAPVAKQYTLNSTR